MRQSGSTEIIIIEGHRDEALAAARAEHAAGWLRNFPVRTFDAATVCADTPGGFLSRALGDAARGAGALVVLDVDKAPAHLQPVFARWRDEGTFPGSFVLTAEDSGGVVEEIARRAARLCANPSSARASLERRIAGALRVAISAHGPITADTVGSAAKRVAGQLLAEG